MMALLSAAELLVRDATGKTTTPTTAGSRFPYKFWGCQFGFPDDANYLFLKCTQKDDPDVRAAARPYLQHFRLASWQSRNPRPSAQQQLNPDNWKELGFPS